MTTTTTPTTTTTTTATGNRDMARRLMLFGIFCWLINTGLSKTITSKPLRPFPWDFPIGGRQCNLPAEKRYQNLFYTEAEIRKLSVAHDIDNIYKLDQIKVKYPFPNVCDDPTKIRALQMQGSNKNTNELRVPTCNDNVFTMIRRRRPGMKWHHPPCCETKMTVTIPSTVQSMFTGETLEVTHSTNSYQFIHEAECFSRGSKCSLGKCKLANRIHWVLVQQSNGNDMFVPVSVGNHCYCGTSSS